MAQGARTEGERFGAWAVVRFLAGGGMDEVYEVVHAAGDLRGALKVPRAVDDPVALARFERGARIAASLDHPHVVRALDVGRSGATPYLVLELLRGVDLSARLARGPLAAEDAVTLALQVCDALAFAHGRRVVHRDLSAANVFLCEGAGVDARVLDFGVARVAGERTLTAPDGLVGTLPYMAPEQCRGERDVDHRADLWSLGVILFEALAGRRPFLADSAYGTLYQITSAPPPDLAALRPDLPAALVEVVTRALTRDRAGRFESADAMAEALRRVPTDLRDGRELARAVDEVWLTTVACVRGVRDVLAVTQAAQELGAVVVPLPEEGAVLASFGGGRWEGDEPQRALRFAAAALPFARGAGVATGHGRASGDDPASRAAGLASPPGATVALDDTTAAMLRGSPSLAPVHSAVTQETPFAGRSLELALLDGVVDEAAAAGGARAAVILGAAGLGRTRLSQEALRRRRAADATFSPLAARGDAARRDAPLAALEDLLGRALRERSPGDPQVPIDRARAALSAALRSRAAGGVATLVLDDAQWLDAASREVLRQVIDDVDHPVALWLFATPDARGAVEGLCAGATVRELGPLAAGESLRVVRAVAPSLPDDDARAVCERAEGHPLFLEELARLRAEGAAGDEVPATIEAAYQALLHRLDPEAREFVRCAAVYGRRAWVEAAAALGADADRYAGLRRAGHLVARPTRLAGATEFAFRSALMQEVALGLWPDDARAGLHAGAARWLAERPDVGPEEVARHWDFARDPDRAALWYALAAESSARVAGPIAFEQAERALARSRDPRVRWRALLAQDTATQIDGDRARHAACVAALEALAPDLGVEEMAEAAWRRCYLARVTARPDEARAAAALAIDLADGAAVARVGVQARVELSLMEANEGRWAEAAAHAATAESLARADGDPWLLARAQTTLGYVLAEVGRAAESLALFDGAAEAYARAGDRRREAIALVNGAAVLLRLGRAAEALERFARAIELSLRIGNVSTVAVALQNRAALHRALGQWDRSRADLDEAAPHAAKLQRVRLDAALAVERAYLALATGAPAGEPAARALDLARRSRSPALLASGLAVALRARPGDPSLVAEARAHAEAVRDTPECEAELRVALQATVGDGGEASAAVERFVRSVGEVDDPGSCREMFRRRYLA